MPVGGPLRHLLAAVGAGATCLRVALDYAETRVQWGRAVAGFQLTQSKLVEIARDATTDATGRCCLAIADQRPTMPVTKR